MTPQFVHGEEPASSAIEQASRRWRGGRRDDSARTCRKILISPPAQIHKILAARLRQVAARLLVRRRVLQCLDAVLERRERVQQSCSPRVDAGQLRAQRRGARPVDGRVHARPAVASPGRRVREDGGAVVARVVHFCAVICAFKATTAARDVFVSRARAMRRGGGRALRFCASLLAQALAVCTRQRAEAMLQRLLNESCAHCHALTVRESVCNAQWRKRRLGQGLLVSYRPLANLEQASLQLHRAGRQRSPWPHPARSGTTKRPARRLPRSGTPRESKAHRTAPKARTQTMYDLVLFVLGVALAEVATTTRLRDWSWHAVIGTLTLTIVAVAGARRAAQRRRDRELDQAERKGFTRGFKAFKGAGKDELRWFDHALEVFYNRYCTDELLLANWIRLTVERSLQNRELLGGVISGVTIPRFTMGESRLVCHRTTPFRVDRPEELYLDLQLKWFSECRAKVAFELHALTGGGVFTCYITNASFEGTLRIGTTFVDQRPWAGQLHLSFVETPKVDFDIEVLKGSVTYRLT